MTTEEQERQAYIQGDLATAELLRITLDAFATIDRVVDEGSDAYCNGWDDGYEVGLEVGKNSIEHEGSTCD